ncbi:chitosanase [Streptomyces humidus]|uniref:Chitosanase n=1 Tax=Streptomyces humidus TaxID=52259 RepID=A0A918FR80_9ACTN|nr:chitosanase [Streptomyces humidus]GGR71832.1 chitosanase [Streptomyces humidus]
MKRAAALVCAAVASTVYLLTPSQTARPAQDAGPVQRERPAQADRRAQPGHPSQPGRPSQAERSAPARPSAPPARPAAGAPATAPGLAAPAQKELAQQIVASAENGTLNWRSAYGYVEDIGDGQGYTAGLIGFCTGTHDLLALVEGYTRARPDNALAPYLPALRRVDGTDSHEGLDPGFPDAWRAESRVPAFRAAQDAERDRVYFDPAVRRGRADGLGALGQFIYYDALVFHGPGTGATSFDGIRARATRQARTPAQGGDEAAYLGAFLDARRRAMLIRHPGIDTSRVDTAQRRFLREGNLDLRPPLRWQVYGETFHAP